REFVDSPAAVVGGNRFHPLRRELRQVSGTHSSTKRGRSIKNGASNLAFVERVPPLLGHQTQRLRDVRIAKHLAELRRPASRQKHAAGFLALPQFVRAVQPINMDDLRHGVTVLSVIDGRSKEVLPWQLAK